MAAALTVAGALGSYRVARAMRAMQAGYVPTIVASRASVSRAASLGGDATYAGQLVQKADEVRAVLLRYTSLGPIAPGDVVDAISAIDAWRATNGTLWSKIEQKLLPMDTTVSEAEAMKMPQPLLRAYIEALYAEATTLLTWYTGGTWQQLVDEGTVTATYVREDATSRLAMLDAILVLEETGVLATAYQAVAQKPLAGLGSPWVVGGLIVIGILAGIAGVVLAVTDFKKVGVDNALKAAECSKWLETGDAKYKGGCAPRKSDVAEIAQYGLLVAGVCVLAYFSLDKLPTLVKGLRS